MFCFGADLFPKSMDVIGDVFLCQMFQADVLRVGFIFQIDVRLGIADLQAREQFVRSLVICHVSVAEVSTAKTTRQLPKLQMGGTINQMWRYFARVELLHRFGCQPRKV